MRKKNKLMLMVALILTVALGTNVFAETSTTTGTCGGYDCYGYATVTSSGGGATVTYGRSASLSATTYYYYINDATSKILNIIYKRDSASDYCSSSVTKPSGDHLRSYKTKGKFSVYYSGASWSDSATAYY